MRPIRRRLTVVLASLAAATATAATTAATTTANAAVYSWGRNINLELGAGYRSPLEASPVPIGGLPANIVEVAAGEGSDAALDSEGNVWTWGGNLYGQAGVGWPGAALVTPVRVLSGVRQISAGAADVVALMNDGTVDVWGGNLFGEAGNGTTTHGHEIRGMSIPSPQRVPGLEHVVHVSGGGSIAAVLSNGTLKVWGRNTFGLLGIGTGGEVTTPTLVPGLTNVKQAAPAPFTNIAGHMLVLLNNGTVLAAGNNTEGALGDGTLVSRMTLQAVHGLPTNISSVGAGAFSSLAVTDTGRLYSWGPNQLGELGIGHTGPRPCGPRPHTCSPLPIELPLTGVTRAAAGIGYDVAVTATGVDTWGDGAIGQLGDGRRHITYSPAAVPRLGEPGSLAAGSFHVVAAAKVLPAPVPWLVSTVGGSSIGLAWNGATSTQKWTVIWQEQTSATRAGSIALSSSARSYTVSGLKPGRWDVYVDNTAAWPYSRVAVASVTVTAPPAAKPAPSGTRRLPASPPPERHVTALPGATLRGHAVDRPHRPGATTPLLQLVK
jgi:alpha-tubulin suppressor-like RCC1 family protein